MRCHFDTPELRRRFEIAWSCLPPNVRQSLKGFLRDVREVKELKDTYIHCPNGELYGPVDWGTGFTFFYKDNITSFCDILFPTLLEEFTEGEALATIIHEFSHAFAYQSFQERAIKESELNSEENAWEQVISWVRESVKDPDLVTEIEGFVFSARCERVLRELVKRAIVSRSSF